MRGAALIVLGCVAMADGARAGGLAPGAADRRAEAAAKAFRAAEAAGAPYAVVVVSGGRVWGGATEAAALARALERRGVPGAKIVREALSFTTRENARYTTRLLAKRGIARAAIVTCDWHMERAVKLFAREGIEVTARVPAIAPRAPLATRAWRWGRERVLAALIGAALAASAGTVSGCAKRDATAASGDARDAGGSWDPADIARAEDLRRAKQATALLAMHDPRDLDARRRVARALARIADGDAIDGLMRALADEDATTAAWGAYGLGAACKGREPAVVKALAARAISFDGDAPKSDARDAVDPRVAIGRAIGRCGGAQAEQVLASWMKRRDGWSDVAAYALGDVAVRGGLAESTMEALIDAAQSAPPLESALYPFARMDRVPDAFAARVAKAALAMMGTAGVGRAIAVRALGRSGPGAVDDLARLALDRSLAPAERADAARALRNLDDAGHAAAAGALAQLVPDTKDALAIARLGEDDFGVLASLVASLGTDVPKKSEPAIFALASLTAPGTPPPSLARRLADLRCGAAAALAKGAYDSDVLTKCDAPTSEASERARLASLLRRSLVGERKAAWRAFTKSPHAKVREAALDAIGAHPELGDAARAALAESLATGKGGLVATAAEVIHAHPDRVLVLADSEKRAALDPSAPPPSAHPLEKLDPAVAAALRGAMQRAWNEDLIEARAAILDAAVAVSLDGAKPAAEAACHDRNVTMRERGARALRALGEPSPNCAPPNDADAGAAPEIARPLDRDVRVVFTTDAGDLAITFEPALAPIAATRFVALAKGRFYDGLTAHRVVPGFVVQLGDPDGDGYGGAGMLLRCETSPVPFGPLDVGVALAGRDTGSSQLFVTLARWPHLDGEYARVGRAEGDWWRVAEGDVIRSVKVEE